MQFGDEAKNAITHLATILRTNLQQQLPTPHKTKQKQNKQKKIKQNKAK